MYEEMEMMNGTCPYCGQVIAVKAMDQQDADLKAADECNCEKAARARRYKGANSYLQQLMAGERCRAAGFVELSEKQIQLASLALESVCKDDVPSVQINLEDSTLKIAAKEVRNNERFYSFDDMYGIPGIYVGKKRYRADKNESTAGSYLIRCNYTDCAYSILHNERCSNWQCSGEIHRAAAIL